MKRVGFAGLGAMGAPMAKNLHRAGLLEAVWNRSREKSLALATELGCQSPATLAELAASVDVVVICVSADSDVRSVVEGLAPGLRPGALVIDRRPADTIGNRR
jgi:3-hydroxyisobutyrate dehydrogenase